MTARGFLESVSQRRQLLSVDVRSREDEDLALFLDGETEEQTWQQLPAADDVHPAPWEVQILAALEDALQRHALSLHYQPQFEVASGRGCGAEVLARWVRTNGESVAPSLFIPLA